MGAYFFVFIHRSLEKINGKIFVWRFGNRSRSVFGIPKLPDYGSREKTRTEGTSLNIEKHAVDHAGNVEAGKKIFEGKKLKCHLCHVVGTDGQKGGPDLLGIADKYDRKKLIESILTPSKEIVAGYATESFVTKSGQSITGIIKHRDEKEVELWVEDGKIVKIDAGEIEEQSNRPISLMPDGLHKLISKDEFSDLIAYLVSLKNPNLYVNAISGAPAKIKPIATPIRFEPIHDDSIRFEHPVWFQPVPGQKNMFVVVENDPGKVWLLEKTSEGMKKSLFLNHRDKVHSGTHMGLMGLAFHPDFENNRKYFLNHHFKIGGQFGTYIVERFAAEDFSKPIRARPRGLFFKSTSQRSCILAAWLRSDQTVTSTSVPATVVLKRTPADMLKTKNCCLVPFYGLMSTIGLKDWNMRYRQRIRFMVTRTQTSDKKSGLPVYVRRGDLVGIRLQKTFGSVMLGKFASRKSQSFDGEKIMDGTSTRGFFLFQIAIRRKKSNTCRQWLR